ncbi:MAG: MATE family efflux transporter [Clostridia bacterium]|nr:MATE family efflux transporter [Clostridia bacterium]
MEKVMKKNNTERMGTAPVLGLIFKMSLPAMFSMLISALYNVVDSMFLGSYGGNSDALTAVSLAYPMQLLMVAFAVGTAVGVNSVIARRLGEGNRKEAEYAATHGVLLAVATWMVYALLGIFASRPFMLLLNSGSEQIVTYGTEYLMIAMVFSLGSFVQIMLEKSIQATGNMLLPMVSHLIGAFTNIILDWFLIFGVGFFPEMGVKGAAIATVAGQWVAMFFLIIVLFKKNTGIKISFKGFKLRFSVIADIYRVGLSGIVMQAVGSLTVALINFIIKTSTVYGSDVSTAAQTVYGVYYKMQSFVFMPVFGLNQGISPILGYNYGAKIKERMMKTLRYAVVIAAVIMFLGTIIFNVFPEPLLNMFGLEPDYIDIGIVALRRISLCFLPASVGVVFTALFQSVGKGVRSLLMSLIRQVIMVLPLAFIFSRIDVNLIWFAFPIAEVTGTIVAILFFLDLNKKDFSKLGQ